VSRIIQPVPSLLESTATASYPQRYGPNCRSAHPEGSLSGVQVEITMDKLNWGWRLNL